MMQCRIAVAFKMIQKGGTNQDGTNQEVPLDISGRTQMAKWIRFEQGGKTGFGTLEGDTIAVHAGDMFAGAKPTGQTLKLSDAQILTPCDPSKMICLWNNFHQLAGQQADPASGYLHRQDHL
jgi:Domain of unknown function (DUF2437)